MAIKPLLDLVTDYVIVVGATEQKKSQFAADYYALPENKRDNPAINKRRIELIKLFDEVSKIKDMLRDKMAAEFMKFIVIDPVTKKARVNDELFGNDDSKLTLETTKQMVKVLKEHHMESHLEKCGLKVDERRTCLEQFESLTTQLAQTKQDAETQSEKPAAKKPSEEKARLFTATKPTKAALAAQRKKPLPPALHKPR